MLYEFKSYYHHFLSPPAGPLKDDFGNILWYLCIYLFLKTISCEAHFGWKFKSVNESVEFALFSPPKWASPRFGTSNRLQRYFCTNYVSPKYPKIKILTSLHRDQNVRKGFLELWSKHPPSQ